MAGSLQEDLKEEHARQSEDTVQAYEKHSQIVVRPALCRPSNMKNIYSRPTTQWLTHEHYFGAKNI